MTRPICEQALDLIRQQEASGRIVLGQWNERYLTAYFCPSHVPTIGYGHTKTVTPADVVNRKRIAVAEAERLLASDMAEFAEGVTQLLTRPATDRQFGALVSLAFNVGINGFRSSTVLREHNAGNPEAAAHAFGLWVKGGPEGAKTTLPGLVVRRAAEAALYLSDTTQSTPGTLQGSMPQAVAPIAAPSLWTLIVQIINRLFRRN